MDGCVVGMSLKLSTASIVTESILRIGEADSLRNEAHQNSHERITLVGELRHRQAGRSSP